jgi:uncharacterized protein YkwD
MPNRHAFICAVVAAATLAAAVPAHAVTATEQSAETRLFSIINSKRAERGLPKLKLHSYIRYESEKHSTYMSKYGMSHDGFNGRWTRIRQHDSGVRSMCENVAYARGYSTYSEAASVIYKVWYKSSSHYKCMFDKLGFTTRSGAVGFRYVNGTWWATFEAAQDSTPGY